MITKKLKMPTLLGRASGPWAVKPVMASMPGKDSSFLFPGAKLQHDLRGSFLFRNFSVDRCSLSVFRCPV